MNEEVRMARHGPVFDDHEIRREVNGIKRWEMKRA